MPRLFSPAMLLLIAFGVAQGQETIDRAERLGRLPAELIKAKKTDAEIMEALFLATLARFPKDQEKENISKHVKAAANRQAAYDDVIWALVNTKEFATLSGMTAEQMLQFSDKVQAAMRKK